MTGQPKIAPAATGAWTHAVRSELERIDNAVYVAVARTLTPTLDLALGDLSDSANHSRIWLAIAAGMSLSGGPRGRRAAAAGVAAIGLASVTVNIGLKPLWRRRRPDRVGAGVPQARHVRMPSSSSFPSGHSASAFAFSTAVGQLSPASSVPLRLLAATIAYSRIHAGVHYPGDVVIGSLTGAIAGEVIAGIHLRRRRRN
ncbi:MAG: phosphatase PAP2 family protein [Solirubrobacterales bacterium]|nr:phosphatase PAP2 family protein [Solirubrobacterales bacterium]